MSKQQDDNPLLFLRPLQSAPAVLAEVARRALLQISSGRDGGDGDCRGAGAPGDNATFAVCEPALPNP